MIKTLSKLHFPEWFMEVLLVLGSFNLFSLNLAFPPYQYFDEHHYVFAGRELLRRGADTNWAHPPLGKLLIGLGTSLFGDTPVGWRFMSMVFGALTVLAIYRLAQTIFKKRSSALAVALLACVNQILFVQSRMATLDVFVVCFSLWALEAFARSWFSEKASSAAFYQSGLLAGLAIACKWSALLVPFFCIGLLLGSGRKIWRDFHTFAGPFLLTPALCYTLVLLLCFGPRNAAYAPPLTPQEKMEGLLPHSQNGEAPSLDALQLKMLDAQLQFANETHPYTSPPLSWPLMLRPMWYEQISGTIDGKHWKQGIFLLGNPLIFWGGLLSIFYCLYSWFKTRSKKAQFIAGIYVVFLLGWEFVPRHTTFFYYYFPAAMILNLALVYAAETLKIPNWVRVTFALGSLALFLFFYPLLSGVLLYDSEFNKRIWFNSWL